MSSPAESSSLVDHIPHPLTKFTYVVEGHTDLVTSVACFPDGRHIASGSLDKTIRIWNVQTGQQEGEALEHDSEVGAMAIAPDGGKIAGIVTVGGLNVWDVVTRKRVRKVKIDRGSGQDAWASMVAFSPDGRCIATALLASTLIQLWDVDTGIPLRELHQDVDRVWSLSFSPDGAHIAAGSSGGSFRVVEISTGKTIVHPIQGHANPVRSLVYSPGGHLLVTGSDESIRVWDTETGREVGRPILLPVTALRCIAISADGKRIASATTDETQARLWNLETRLPVGDLFTSRSVQGQVYSLTFSPSGRFVVGGGVGCVHLVDIAAVFDSTVTASPPATSNRESSRSIIPSAHVTTHPSPSILQQKQTAPEVHRDTSSLSSSILNLPAVVQPKPERVKEVERAPSIDDWDSFQSPHQPITEPTETQQEPQAEPQNPNTPPSAAEFDNRWMRVIHRRWRHLLSRKPRAHVEMPQDSPHSPSKEHPMPRKHPDPGPATDPPAILMQGDHTGDEAHVRNSDAHKQFLVRFWDRLRRSGASRHKSRPRGQKQPTPGVVDVAGGRDKVRLVMSPDTEEYGVPPEPVELPPIASRPPSFFEIEVDPSKGWSWSRELRELICCYWCFPRNTRPV